MISINMNEKVKVKLTDYGLEILKEKMIDYPDPDCLGYYRFHLWEMSQIFGEFFYMGNNRVPFEDNEILFN